MAKETDASSAPKPVHTKPIVMSTMNSMAESREDMAGPALLDFRDSIAAKRNAKPRTNANNVAYSNALLRGAKP